MVSLDQAKDFATIAAPFTGAIVSTWIKPTLAEILKKRKTNRQLLENAFVERFTDYLERSYEKHSYINTVVFPNQKKLLKDLYIPLRLVQPRDKNPRHSLVSVDGYPDTLLQRERNLLITDTAGMGKSTLLKRMFLGCIEDNKGIPIFIELRRLSEDVSILSFILDELNPIEEEFDEAFVLARIKRGDFVFFLDGYDEIGFDQRQAVTNELRNFQTKARNNIFVMSSRPEVGLASFTNFAEYRIEPLAQEEAFELILKYGENQPIATQLIDKLKTDIINNIQEFLGNPLLVSLLFKSYEYKPTVAFKKHVFYRQVYDALFESHDFSKEGAFARIKGCSLDSSDFHRVLRTLGYETIKLGRVEYSTDEILKLLRMIKPLCPGITIKEDAFLKDLISTVPLFIKEGDEYRWAHKSIQEYFAAQFICEDSKEHQLDILKGLYASPRATLYMNILDICYDMDFKSFRKAILAPLANSILSHLSKSERVAKSLGVSPADVEKRLLWTFGRKMAFLDQDAEREMISQEFKEAMEEIFGAEPEMLHNAWVHPLRQQGMLGHNLLELQERDWLILRILEVKQSGLVANLRKFRTDARNITVNLDDPVYVVDLRKANPINSPENFSVVTDEIVARAGTAPVVLAWQKLKSDVEEEEAREKGTGFLIAGL